MLSHILGRRTVADILGTKGKDSLLGSADADVIFGSTGNDTLDGAQGSDLLGGDAGNDLLTGGTGIDTLYGGNGQDTLIGTNGDLLYAEAGDDTLIVGADFRGPPLNAHGGSGDDSFLSVAAGLIGQTDYQFGLRLYGDHGNDSFTFDIIQASTMEGGNGDDRFTIRQMLSGSLSGDGGDDQFDVGLMLGRIAGGSGGDLIAVGAAKVGGSSVLGEDGNDIISVGGGTCDIDGGGGDDVLSSGLDLFAPPSHMEGGTGNDRLSSQGRDILLGEDGHDTLESGAWENTLTGGAGSDRFVYGDLVYLEGFRGADTITDFNGSDGDVLDLSRLLERVGASSDPVADGWIALEFQEGNTLVLFDLNGGGDDLDALVTLEGTDLTGAAAGNLILWA
jgi:serralysin